LPAKKGDYCGGIWTLQHLKDRCHIEEGTGCWLWRGAMNKGVPNINVRIDGRKLNMRGSRAAKCLEKGAILPKHVECWRVVGCSDTCVNPKHVKAATAKERGEYTREHQTQRHIPSRIAAARIGGKAKRKLTQDQVDMIRSSDESTCELARMLGVSRYAIWAIRTYKHWRDGAANNSVFTWRPAA
jgi:hypothetical protein